MPDLNCLAEAIQIYTKACYVTHPEVRPKGGHRYDYTKVQVEWEDEKWKVSVFRTYTRRSLPLVQKVVPHLGSEHLYRRDSVIEVVRDGIHLRRDPASGVYLTGSYHLSQEILQAATIGPFRVNLGQDFIFFEPSEFPMVMRYKNPGKRVDLHYKQHLARITLGSGELLAHLAVWRMTE